MLDLESEVQWFNTYWGNILKFECFCFHIAKPLMPILALLSTLFNYEKPRIYLFQHFLHLAYLFKSYNQSQHGQVKHAESMLPLILSNTQNLEIQHKFLVSYIIFVTIISALAVFS